MATDQTGLAQVQSNYIAVQKSAQFGFIGATYTSRSRAADGERALNLYPEMVESGHGKNAVVLYTVPGRKVFATLPDAPVRGVFDEPESGRVFAVGGDHVYELRPDGTAGELGSFDPPLVSWASNGVQVGICNGSTIYSLDLTSNKITPTNHSAARIAFLDGYVLGIDGNSGKFHISALYDDTSWAGLDFATAEACPDNLISMLADHREAWLFGTETVEVWYDAGNPAFPFERVPGGFIEEGCGAAESPAQADNSVFWLGAGRRGNGIVWRANGYTPQRVSNHAVETAVQSYPRIDDAVGYSYQEDGHSFYQLTFPSANPGPGGGVSGRTLARGATWVYDCASGMWHERGWWDSTHALWLRDRGACHAFGFGLHLVGDYSNGNIYQQSLDIDDDAGTPIAWLRSAPHVSNEARVMTYDELVLDMQVGDGLAGAAAGLPAMPLNAETEKQFARTVMLQSSNDGGYTWGAERPKSAGRKGSYRQRVRWNRLGQARDRCFRVQGTGRVALLNAYLRTRPGNGS